MGADADDADIQAILEFALITHLGGFLSDFVLRLLCKYESSSDSLLAKESVGMDLV